MEIFSWLTFAATASFVFRRYQEPFAARDFDPYIPWKTCIALFVITVLGNVINGTPDTDKVYSIGSQRWFLLFFSTSFALALWPPKLKGYRFFLIFTSITAVYAISQSFTGYDVLRPGSHRAVWPLDLEATTKLWRSSGLMGSPLQYAYNAGMYACIALAAALLSFNKRKEAGWFFWGSALAFVLIALSLVTTFTRGVWIAMALAWIAMAWIVARPLAFGLIGSGAAAAIALFFTVDQFRVRVLSLFNMGYQSNSDRMFLWKLNWQMFQEYPILGIGYQQNEARSGEYVARMGLPDAFTGHAHNNYLQMLAGTGITGFAAYMFIIGFMLWVNWRLWKKIPENLIWARTIVLGALGAQILLHIGGFTECNFKTGTTNHNFMMIWGLLASMSVLEAKGLLNKTYDVTLPKA
jgi:O-antigen ligase